jgi:hypothetical protein
MSTVIRQEDAAPSTTPAAAAPAGRLGRARLIRLVSGSLGLLAALALIGGAIAATVELETKRDGTGYFATHTHHYQTSSYALSTESLDVGGVTGALEAGLVRLRIAVTSRNGTKPLFIGIARTADVDRYLTGVERDELRNIEFNPFKIDYRRLGGDAPTAPSTQSFWQARAGGTGTQTLSWPVEKGKWTFVAMNADGSRSVSVDAQLAAHLSGAWWFVAAFVALGALSLAGGVALLRLGLRGNSR